MATFLDFEKPIAELEARVAELRDTASSGAINIEAEIQKLQERAERLLRETYTRLTPWQKTQVARHPERPHFKHYVEGLIEDFVPLAGDRNFGEDLAIMGGFGKLGGRRVLVIGHEKGDDVASRLRHNFGMAKPEGYRKAIRLMQLADRFGLPVVSLVDTSGAFPGVQAEERGQAEAIARSTEACLALGVPLVAAIVGEGGSGGAIAIAAANRVLMLEHSVYSVISPEGCASILWRTSERAADAAEAMKMTAADLAQLGVVDRVVAEPVGGAHRSPSEAVKALGARSARSSTHWRRCGPNRCAATAGQSSCGSGEARTGARNLNASCRNERGAERVFRLPSIHSEGAPSRCLIVFHAPCGRLLPPSSSWPGPPRRPRRPRMRSVPLRPATSISSCCRSLAGKSAASSAGWSTRSAAASPRRPMHAAASTPISPCSTRRWRTPSRPHRGGSM
jgi:acetyl-CoA carboxylase carboxyl transferase subunit alpha